ncbi:indole-3-glycerol phosphate synthase TrpC [Clostridium cylindrosporum]|uniref:Indole-3-glycerol phosphate synthase n=1 Tax=Clostridium cylindrosporum DSM 605 TaxID=1121307 RepID=A0A0J8FZ76_CLOCY|nr:indole-3-glycerol phosphate synthase TrpC [Clostridium cylindrosporum]KMT20921.1 indole-3-glycerol phosphate synthase TrpC [Clostridium cylindrosporum DSM 605]
MRNILDEIIEYKKSIVEAFKRKPISFVEKVKNNPYVSIISEVKRASPSKGDLNINLDPRTLSSEYERLGATAVSVLTDSKYFKGSFEDLRMVRESVNIPVLCKDFVIDKVQIDYAKLTGADIILLIVAALSDESLKELYDYARSLDLDVIVEVHNEEEVKRALKISPRIIGVNNRDLKTFKTDISITLKLAQMIKESGAILISESGITSKEDIETLSKAKIDAVLVGEGFVKSNNLDESFNGLRIEKNV